MKKIILSAVISSLGLMACTPPVVPDTFVRFINSVPDAGGIKIFINDSTGESIRENPGSLLATNAAYPSLSTYKTLKAGNLTYILCPDNALPACPPASQVNLSGDQKKSLFLIGTNTKSDDSGVTARPLAIIALTDENADPTAGKSKIRVFHAAALPSLNQVDVYITKPADPLEGIPIELNYSTNNTYREFTAGTLKIRATERGVTTSALIDSGDLEFVAGKNYTVMVHNTGVSVLTDK